MSAVDVDEAPAQEAAGRAPHPLAGRAVATAPEPEEPATEEPTSEASAPHQPASPIVLRVQGLTKTFREAGREDLIAVDDVSFELAAGETLGVVGESGSGKSTVARLVCRLLDADAGAIELAGRDITRVRGAELRRAYGDLQMVFQTPTGSFDPRRTLGDGIGESLRNRGTSRAGARARVEELLGQCGLPADFADRYPHQVSGGQCQRAALARALAVEPRVLILDEATSALDVTVQRQIMDLLVRLREQHDIAYLFICHNLALVQEFCDRVLVMSRGRVVEEGVPDGVILSPRSAAARRLVDVLPACSTIPYVPAPSRLERME